jgi:tRNA threonylcarbamoyladenosine biosynthesis protein TsaB
MSEGACGLVLALDGSTNASTAALLTRPPEWRVLAHRTDTEAHGQARVLLRLVDDMLHQTGRGPTDIAAIVVGIGPGTFTGVRIAVATARALALALPSPVVGVGTLSALAAEAAWRVAGAARLGARHGSAGQAAPAAEEHPDVPDLIVPTVDARRGQLFYGVYRASGEADERRYVREEAYAACDRGELAARVEQAAGPAGERRHVLVVGEVGGLSGADGPGGAPSIDVGLLPVEVRAERLVAGQGRLAGTEEAAEGAWLGPWLQSVLDRRSAGGWEPFRAGELGSPEAVKPIYVRSPDADLHITKMRDPWAGPASGR